MADEFVMPRPFTHEIVNFYFEGRQEPTPAWVRYVGDNNTIAIVTLGGRILHEACRHRDDPSLQKMDDRFVHSWDFTDQGKFIRELGKVIL